MKVKVCGMRDSHNIRAIAELGIDYMGFIFWDKSPRKVNLQLFSEKEEEMAMNSHVKRVGVFVDEPLQNVIDKATSFHLDFIQLHGNESATYIDKLRQLTNAKIIKAISIREAEDVNRWRDYNGHVDMLLFDTKCKCIGGSGEQFDWSVLERYDGEIPFLLSGGIGPGDVERVKAFHHPSCIGVDLNSKFEDAPGLKNIKMLNDFLLAIRQ